MLFRIFYLVFQVLAAATKEAGAVISDCLLKKECLESWNII